MIKMLNAVTTSLFVYLMWVFVVAPFYGFQMTPLQTVEIHLAMTGSALLWQGIYGVIVKLCYPR